MLETAKWVILFISNLTFYRTDYSWDYLETRPATISDGWEFIPSHIQVHQIHNVFSPKVSNLVGFMHLGNLCDRLTRHLLFSSLEKLPNIPVPFLYIVHKVHLSNMSLGPVYI